MKRTLPECLEVFLGIIKPNNVFRISHLTANYCRQIPCAIVAAFSAALPSASSALGLCSSLPSTREPPLTWWS